tara:strand:+ start:1827 stop:2537 length:711 start_codon:yes stop_codon:yes gene_type:complete
MNIVILGNGPSLKKVINYGFDKFILYCRSKNIKVICMNKILRYFDENNIVNYPDFYVATDTLVNIQMYNEILKYVDKFEEAFVSIPYYYDINENILEIIKREDINKQKIPFNKSKQTIISEESDIKSKCTLCKHEMTGLSSLFIANSLKPNNIYMIGMDETYQLPDEPVIKCNESDNSNYFIKSYLKSDEYVSYAPKFRVDIINKYINKIDTNVYNLSDISNINGEKMSFEDFFNL